MSGKNLGGIVLTALGILTLARFGSATPINNNNNNNNNISVTAISIENLNHNLSYTLDDIFKVPDGTYSYDANANDLLMVSRINHWNNYFSQFGLSPDDYLKPNDLKILSFVENGISPKGMQIDPLSITHQGNPTLDVLSGKSYEGIKHYIPEKLMNDFSKIIPTPYDDGWVYDKTNIDIKLAIDGGILTLFSKKAIFADNIEYQEIGFFTKTYEVKDGDCLCTIAINLNTDVDILYKYNNLDDESFIYPGDLLSYKEVEYIRPIVGWKSWDQAFKDYNGNGVENYLTRIDEFKEYFNY